MDYRAGALRHLDGADMDAVPDIDPGEADHQPYLEAPFHAARAAIHKRMHELGIAH